MFELKKGMRVWFASNGSRLHPNRRLTIKTVGRRWVTFEETEYSHADKTTGRVYERSTGSQYPQGDLWESEKAWKSNVTLASQWETFCSTLGCTKHKLPEGMTLERIVRARAVLGMERNLKLADREIFSAVRDPSTYITDTERDALVLNDIEGIG